MITNSYISADIPGDGRSTLTASFKALDTPGIVNVNTFQNQKVPSMNINMASNMNISENTMD